MKEEVSCDTSVLLNFLKIDRVDLLVLTPYIFYITDHVHQEISNFYPEQQAILERAVKNGVFKNSTIETPQEWALFGELSKTGQLGSGECAAIAFASCKEILLAIDDKRAVKKASQFLPQNSILKTENLICKMINQNLLSLDEASQIIEIWASKHRFKINISRLSEIPKELTLT